MHQESIPCRLRTARKRSGLSQAEVANLLGFSEEITVSRHERSVTIPSLLTALGYQVIFRTSISELFPGIYRTVESNIEEQLAKLEEKLHQSTLKGRQAIPIARQLEFLNERKNEPTN